MFRDRPKGDISNLCAVVFAPSHYTSIQLPANEVELFFLIFCYIGMLVLCFTAYPNLFGLTDEFEVKHRLNLLKFDFLCLLISSSSSHASSSSSSSSFLPSFLPFCFRSCTPLYPVFFLAYSAASQCAQILHMVNCQLHGCSTYYSHIQQILGIAWVRDNILLQIYKSLSFWQGLFIVAASIHCTFMVIVRFLPVLVYNVLVTCYAFPTHSVKLSYFQAYLSYTIVA